MALTKLFDCEYRGGRAESAPKLRDSDGTKSTLQELWAVGEQKTGGTPATRHPGKEEGVTEIPEEPIMPHRVFSKQMLDHLYPPLVISEDDGDTEEDVDDLLEHGMRIAGDIHDKANVYGRRRVERTEAG